MFKKNIYLKCLEIIVLQQKKEKNKQKHRDYCINLKKIKSMTKLITIIHHDSH